ncbi:MAG: amino acid ABC transporter substrate-binding protein [Lachnospiraceae bacterium]|nr:amino acid ABC transporter substrate-binding protein [Lachnospiraceae bacterium]
MKRPVRTRTVTGIVSLLILTFLAGCGGKDAGSDDGSLKKIQDAGELVVGLDENYPPMGFHDASGEITGFDIDLAKEVCDRLGVKLVPHPVNWDDKEKELNEGNIDCIWNGLSANPSRSASMNLSQSYIKNDIIVVVRGNSGIKSIDDLKGLKAGVQTGSSAEEAVAGSGDYSEIEIESSDDNVELFERLDEGILDAVIMDSIFAYYYIGEHDGDYYVLPSIIETEEMAIAFRKGEDALKNAVWDTLKKMKEDGSMAEISEKWFGSDVTIVR